MQMDQCYLAAVKVRVKNTFLKHHKTLLGYDMATYRCYLSLKAAVKRCVFRLLWNTSSNVF